MKTHITFNFDAILFLNNSRVLLRLNNDKTIQDYLEQIIDMLVRRFPEQVKVQNMKMLLITVPYDVEFLIQFAYYCMLTFGIQIIIGSQIFKSKHYTYEESKKLEGAIEEFYKTEKIRYLDRTQKFQQLAKTEEEYSDAIGPSSFKQYPNDDDDGLSYVAR